MAREKDLAEQARGIRRYLEDAGVDTSGDTDEELLRQYATASKRADARYAARNPTPYFCGYRSKPGALKKLADWAKEHPLPPIEPLEE